MTPAEALKIALSKETSSIELYKKLSADHTAIRDLLSNLLNEEEKHKKMIEKKIAELDKY